MTVVLPTAQANPRTTCTTGCITTYDTPPTTAGAGPFGIVRGPLGSQWFTYGDAVARIDKSGKLTRYPLPTAGASTRWMTADRRGRVWFTEFGKIGWIRVSDDGSTTLREYAVPYDDAGIISLVLTRHHRAYFTEQSIGKIGRINTRTGAYREYPLPSNDPLGMTLGPDGALWYTDRANAKVGRMTLNGKVREWSLPSTANLQRIVSGPDGALWFTDLRGNRLWRITTSGVAYVIPDARRPSRDQRRTRSQTVFDPLHRPGIGAGEPSRRGYWPVGASGRNVCPAERARTRIRRLGYGL